MMVPALLLLMLLRCRLLQMRHAEAQGLSLRLHRRSLGLLVNSRSWKQWLPMFRCDSINVDSCDELFVK